MSLAKNILATGLIALASYTGISQDSKDAEIKRANQTIEGKLGIVSGDNQGTEFRVKGPVFYGDANLSINSFYKKAGDLKSRTLETLFEMDKLSIGMNLAGESFGRDGSSTSHETFNEAVPYVVDSSENNNSNVDKKFNRLDVKYDLGNWNILFGFTNDSRTTKDSSNSMTNVTFPSNPEILPVFVSTDVRSKSKVDDRSFLFGLSGKLRSDVDLGIFIRNNSVKGDGSVHLDGSKIADLDASESVNSYGARTRLEYDKALAGVLLQSHTNNDLNNGQNLDFSAHGVLQTGDKAYFGGNVGKLNGDGYIGGLFFLNRSGAQGKGAMSDINGFLESLENRDVYAGGRSERQNFFEKRDRFADLTAKGASVYLQRGEDLFRAGFGAPITDSASFSVYFEKKNGISSMKDLELNKGFNNNLRLSLGWLSEKDNTRRDSTWLLGLNYTSRNGGDKK